MTGPFRTTAILFGILAAVAIFYLLVGSKQETPEPATKDLSVKLWAFQPTELQTITIVRGDKRLELARPSGDRSRWQIRLPVSADADSATMARIESDLAELKADRLVSEQALDLTQYGLERPQLQITLGLVDGQSRTVLAGKENPVVNGVYGKLADDPKVYLLPAQMVQTWALIVDQPPQARPTAIPSPLPTLPPAAPPKPQQTTGTPKPQPKP